MVRIIDCSIAFNETLMLNIRARELKDIVSDIVVIEATRTHTGKPKAIFFENACVPLRESGISTVYQIIDDMPNLYVDDMQNRFIAEIFQRNCILRPLSMMALKDEDIILISDIDEIPTSSAVEEAVRLLEHKKIVIFEQKLKRFFLNNKSIENYNNAPWLGTVACRYGSLKRLTPQGARIGDPLSPRAAVCSWGYDRDLYPYEARVYNAGWHLSSMGGIEALKLKLESVAEGGRSGQYQSVEKTAYNSHNRETFRVSHQSEISEFLSQNHIVLDNVYADSAESYINLEIPSAVKENILEYESLFFLNNTIS